MKHPVPVNKVEPADRHGHPTLDVGRQKDEGLVTDDVLQVGRQELEHEVEVALVGEDRQELARRGRQAASEHARKRPSLRAPRPHLDHVVVPELAKKLDLPDGRHVEPVLELANLDLLDGNVAPRGDLLAYPPSSSDVSSSARWEASVDCTRTSVDGSIRSLADLGLLGVGLAVG